MTPASRSLTASGDGNGTLLRPAAEAEVGEVAALGGDGLQVQEFQPGGVGEGGDGVGVDDGPAEPGAVVGAPFEADPVPAPPGAGRDLGAGGGRVGCGRAGGGCV